MAASRDMGRAVKAAGAFSVLAHPWWRHKRELEFSLDAFCPEAIDVMSLNADTSRLAESLALARARGMRLLCGSDAHGTEQLGVFHIDTDREDMYRYAEMFRQGGTLAEFYAQGGTYDCFFVRRQAGGSFYPPAGVVGRRGDRLV